jgi:hypothetical protein
VARSTKTKGTKGNAESRCPLTAKPRLRLASNAQTASIKDYFPRGVAQPALRALFAAGLTTLNQLVQVSEAELLALHGMGPKAVATLCAALRANGLDLRAS